MSDVEFEVIPASARPAARSSNKYGALFAAIDRGETVRIPLPAGKWADNAVRAMWAHTHRGVTLRARKDGNGGLVLWKEDGPA